MQSRESIERRRNCSLSFSSYVSLLFSVCLVACEKEEKESEGSRGATSAECAESERERKARASFGSLSLFDEEVRGAIRATANNKKQNSKEVERRGQSPLVSLSLCRPHLDGPNSPRQEACLLIISN